MLIAALLSGSVVAAILNAYLKKDLEEFLSGRERKETVLTEVVGPATMHFARTIAIADRYGASSAQLFGDADLLRDSNVTMRSLLISKGHLIPSALLKPTQCLIVHYDIWLKRFDATKQQFVAERGREPRINDRFDVGFAELEDKKCGGFPNKLPDQFSSEFERLRKELYEIE